MLENAADVLRFGVEGDHSHHSFDVVNLTDPLVQLFGMSRPAVGSLEVRTNKPGALSVTSGVDAPSETGGTFGFQMPVVLRGSGAKVGSRTRSRG